MADRADPHANLIAGIRREFSGDVNFPTCFDATLRIRRVLATPDVSIDVIHRAVASEPLLCTRLLKLANSAYRNPAGSAVSSLRIAIMRLGNEAVRTVAFAVAIDQMTRLPGMAKLAPVARQCWEFSLELASTAQALANRDSPALAEDALLAGLTSHLGAFFILYRAADISPYSNAPEAALAASLESNFTIGEPLLTALELPSHITLSILTMASAGAETRELARLMQRSFALAARPEGWPITDDLAASREQAAALIAEISENVSEIRQALAG